MGAISEEWRGKVRERFIIFKKKKEIYVPESLSW